MLDRLSRASQPLHPNSSAAEQVHCIHYQSVDRGHTMVAIGDQFFVVDMVRRMDFSIEVRASCSLDKR